MVQYSEIPYSAYLNSLLNNIALSKFPPEKSLSIFKKSDLKKIPN